MRDDLTSETYHEGEIAVQRQAGVRNRAEKVGEMVQETIPDLDNVRNLLAAEPHVVVTSVAPDGDVWVSLLADDPGFLSVEDERHLRVETDPAPGDPLATHLRAGMPAGVLVIEPRNRERVRFNGTVIQIGEGFVLETAETFPNCDKYVQQRSFEHIETVDTESDDRTVTDGLRPRHRAWIGAADTFFIGSHYSETGADASHRGGDPGFVDVEGDTVVSPDYPGNSMFCTLGNIQANPRVGLLFVDFADGRTLQVTGHADIVWDERRVAQYDGAERLVEITVDQAVELPDGNPLRWSLEERSPFNP